MHGAAHASSTASSGFYTPTRNAAIKQPGCIESPAMPCISPAYQHNSRLCCAHPCAFTKSMPRTNTSVQHRSVFTQASGSPVRKGTSTTAPARPASLKPRPGSPVIVDLCVSPLQQPRAGSSNAAATAGDNRADRANEVEMVDASQSGVREAQPVMCSIASAAAGRAKGEAPASLFKVARLSTVVLTNHYT